MSLRLSAFTTKAVSLSIQGYFEVGKDLKPFADTVAVPASKADGTKQVLINYTCPYGTLVSASISLLTSGVGVGECFARGEILYTLNNEPYAIIFSAYVTSFTPVGYPFSGVQATTDGPGRLFSSTKAAFAGNVNGSYQNPNSTLQRLLGIFVNFVAGGTSAARNIAGQVSDNNGVVLYAFPSNYYPQLVDGSTGYISFVSNYYQSFPSPTLFIAGAVVATSPLPANIIMKQNWTVSLIPSVSNASDTFTPTFFFEEWISP